jgi:hypothetical protein
MHMAKGHREAIVCGHDRLFLLCVAHLAGPRSAPIGLITHRAMPDPDSDGRLSTL